MDNSRMANADMIRYCDEALAWEDFGPVDIFFFESVKKILLGQCSAFEEPEEADLMGIERPVQDVELEPEYGNYADIYYGEEGDEDIPDYSRTKEDEAFDSKEFEGGFFEEEKAEETKEEAKPETEEKPEAEAKSEQGDPVEGSGSFTINV